MAREDARRFGLSVLVVALVAACGGGSATSSVSTPTATSTPQSPPSSSPAAEPTAAPTLGALPDALGYRWIGDPRDLPVLGPSTRTGLNFTTTQFSLTGTEYGSSGILRATASTTSDGNLQLVSTSNEGGCAIGSIGSYRWTLSPGGTVLTIESGPDACAARAALLPGTWARIACRNPDNGCLGDLEAGEHRSQYIVPRLAPGAPYAPDLGAVTYTTPAGWSNSSDWPGLFTLTPSPDYAKEGPDGPTDNSYHQIYIGVTPAAIADVATCAKAVAANSPRTVAGLIEFIRNQPGLVSSKPTSVTIDGHSGQWVDVHLATSWKHTCPYAPSVPTVDLLVQDLGGDDPWEYGLSGAERERLFFIDLGHDVTVFVVIDSTEVDRFTPLVAAAMPIVESMRFR